MDFGDGMHIVLVVWGAIGFAAFAYLAPETKGQ